MPASAVLIQLSLPLTELDLELSLDWLPREHNVEDDALANEQFKGFNPESRMELSLDQFDLELPRTRVKDWHELEDCIKERKGKPKKLQSANPGIPKFKGKRVRGKPGAKASVWGLPKEGVLVQTPDLAALYFRTIFIMQSGCIGCAPRLCLGPPKL